MKRKRLVKSKNDKNIKIYFLKISNKKGFCACKICVVFHRFENNVCRIAQPYIYVQSANKQHYEKKIKTVKYVGKRGG